MDSLKIINEIRDNSRQAKAEILPKNLRVMRYCISHGTLADASKLALTLWNPKNSGALDGQSPTARLLAFHECIYSSAYVFSAGVKRALRNAFMKADYALADAKCLYGSSSTTALTALVLGWNMIIANAGDSRAVLVTCALGDCHMKGSKGSNRPSSSEPELEEVVLTEEDEFLIIGCDGLWDVMSSQCAVTIVRKELMLHNDPQKCSKELVREAIKRNT
ncbi:putative protein phosphatase 2C 47 [Abeliophyllum distichum]|uniref:PPM-type phosphatase domain-containing protein n=1 Tax=Abeliophyllum distichum TaxID=126358 RepID=A0ABD1V2K8_9LAMI